MSGNLPSLHVTSNIKTIEKLKCELLAKVSDLYEHLLDPGGSLPERGQVLADIVVAAYVLSARLGIPYATLDEQIFNRLKLCMLDEKHPLQDDTAHLLKYMEGME